MIHVPEPRLLFAQQDQRIDGEGAARGNPRGDQAEQQHGAGDADQHQRIFRRGLVDDEGEDARGQQAQHNAGNRADGEQAKGAAERCAQDLPLRLRRGRRECPTRAGAC